MAHHVAVDNYISRYESQPLKTEHRVKGVDVQQPHFAIEVALQLLWGWRSRLLRAVAGNALAHLQEFLVAENGQIQAVNDPVVGDTSEYARVPLIVGACGEEILHNVSFGLVPRAIMVVAKDATQQSQHEQALDACELFAHGVEFGNGLGDHRLSDAPEELGGLALAGEEAQTHAKPSGNSALDASFVQVGSKLTKEGGAK